MDAIVRERQTGSRCSQHRCPVLVLVALVTLVNLALSHSLVGGAHHPAAYPRLVIAPLVWPDRVPRSEAPAPARDGHERPC